jgi:GxxExxY protein
LAALCEDKNVNENEIGKIVVDVAVNLHKEIGPGLLESVYEKLLAFELKSKGLKMRQQDTAHSIFHPPYPLHNENPP